MAQEDAIRDAREALCSSEDTDKERSRAVDVLRAESGGAAVGVLDVDGCGEGVVGSDVEEEVKGGEEPVFVVAFRCSCES